MLMSLSRWRPLALGTDSAPSSGGASAGAVVGSLARDRAWAMVSSSMARWQRWASRSGFLGRGGGGFAGTAMGELTVLGGPPLLAPIEGRAGAGRLVEVGFTDTTTDSGMLLGLAEAAAAAAGGPGGGGAGRRRGMERGGGGRGGGGRCLGLFVSVPSSASCLSVLLPSCGAAGSLTTSSVLSAKQPVYGRDSASWWRWWRVCRNRGLTMHRGPLLLLLRLSSCEGTGERRVGGALSL